MLFLWRSCGRSVGLSVKTIFSQAAAIPPGIDIIPNLDSPPLMQRNSPLPYAHRSRRMEWLERDLEDALTSEAKKVLSSITTEHSAWDMNVQGTRENYNNLVSSDRVDRDQCMAGLDVHSAVLDGINSHVSLHGCMQSNVPHPHSSGLAFGTGYTSDHSMPGHSNGLRDKYTGGSLIQCHPSRQFFTSATHNSPTRIWSANKSKTAGLVDSDCEVQQLLHSVKKGQKTLQNIFDEHDKLIIKVVKDYQQNRNYSTSRKSEVRSSDSATSNGNPSKDGDTSSPNSTPSLDGKSNLSQKDKLKRAIKEYGGTVLVFYFGLSTLSLCSWYIAVSSGLDVHEFLKQLGIAENLLESLTTSYGNFTTLIVAYALHKIFLPVRIGLTLTCTPLIVRRLRKMGFIKPPTTGGKSSTAK